MTMRRLVGWLVVVLILAFSLWALWVSVRGVGAESIEECILDSSPDAHAVIAVQWPDDGNLSAVN